jgi:hypothetical protein
MTRGLKTINFFCYFHRLDIGKWSKKIKKPDQFFWRIISVARREWNLSMIWPKSEASPELPEHQSN